MVHIERDSKFKNFENQVTDQLMDIIKTIEPEKKEIPTANMVNFISIEDAAKELLQMGVKG